MPARREGELKENRLDDRAGAMGAEQPMYQEELSAAELRGPHRLQLASTMEFVEPQALEHADRRMDGGVGRAKPALAIPPPVGHLLLQHVVGKGVETVVLVREVRQDGKYHPGDARLAWRPAVVDAAVPLEPAVEKERASPSRLPVVDWQTKVAEQQHGVGSRDPLGRVESTVRRLPARPRALRVLPGEQTSATTVARDPSPFALDGAFGRAYQITQGLPTNSRVPVEEPVDCSLRPWSQSHY